MQYTYMAGDRQVTLEPDPTVVAVRFDDRAPKSGRARATEAVRGLSPFTSRFEVPGERLTIVPVPPPAIGGIGPAAAISGLDNQPEVAKALPVFRVGPNQVVPTERVILAVKAGEDAEVVARRHDLTPTAPAEEGRIVATVADSADIFAACRALAADPAVDYAEPDFVTIGRHMPAFVPTSPGPLDPLLSEQYALRLIGALAAQRLAPARREVTIAILDEGVDTRHPDLAAAVINGYDAVDKDSYQEPNPWDGHGTACAGLAAAIGGNGIGIRGVAAGCGLLPVRIAYSNQPGGPWVTRASWIRDAIRWSWMKAGASVISNSWSGGADSMDIRREIESARTLGRSGRGCVVLFAAGNDGGPVLFPSNLPNLLTVGASNQFDEVKTRTSADGENWASNHGPVAVTAPGVRNLTTDIRDGSGYHQGDYVPWFNGTSSATPLVAGVCGLILSIRPELTEAQVRQLICDTAVKIGPFPYTSGRNDHAGFGRVDALAAVQAALAV
ncbi:MULTISPECIES: S8 family serine peptidase [Roseomonadaceae]|uniref:S8 family serine peptidase n=1 Tax=Falsiroseomonas oleicola TaxID=2801474 RepID=A0ABS6HD04_9PROT|nr:S8 family serine peptidase [Roseomonas oleicola]MBU8545697.1 S8 family serine peptidase [Roseomonas oleicola]